VLNGENIDALRLAEDVRIMIRNEVAEENLPIEIPVEIINSDAAKVFMNSRSGEVNFSKRLIRIPNCHVSVE
jgi:hypothetical protein